MKLEVGRASLVASAHSAGSDVADFTLSDSEVSEEHEVTRLHPAMFRNHPFVFVASLLLLIATIAGGGWLAVDGYLILACVVGVLALAVGIWFFAWWLKVVYTTLTVTSKRTVYREGIVSKSTSEVRHDDVRNLQVDQDFLDRVLGVGTISVSSAGQDELEIVAKGFPRVDEIADSIRSFQG